jgi:hypothetical protein
MTMTIATDTNTGLPPELVAQRDALIRLRNELVNCAELVDTDWGDSDDPRTPPISWVRQHLLAWVSDVLNDPGAYGGVDLAAQMGAE